MKELFYSTGQFAKFCGVGHRTVLRWVKDGLIDAYELPGRGDHRITAEEAVRFMQKHKIPIPAELAEYIVKPIVLVVEEKADLSTGLKRSRKLKNCEVKHAKSSFQAGAMAVRDKPAAIVVSRPQTNDSKSLMDFVRDSDAFAGTAVVPAPPKSTPGEIAESVTKTLVS